MAWPTTPDTEELCTGGGLTCAVAAQDDAGTVRLVVAGELDRDTAASLCDWVERLAARRDVVTLSIDLSGLRFIDARGVGTLLAVRERALRHGVHVRVIAAGGVVRWVLDIVGVDLT